MEKIVIRVHAIVLDAGMVTEQQVKTLLQDASAIYAPASVEFRLEGALEAVNDPALQRDRAEPLGQGIQFELKREARSLRHWGRYVVLFRNYVKGSPLYADAGNYASEWPDYIVMGGLDGGTFAHESGHFFGLPHTHSGFINDLNDIMWDARGGDATAQAQAHAAAVALAGQLIEQNGGDVAATFDGDRGVVSDTPPDPGTPLFQPGGYDSAGNQRVSKEECAGSGKITVMVNGDPVELEPDRTNLMSYFKHCQTTPSISQHQIAVIRRSLESGHRRHLHRGVSFEGPAAAAIAGTIHVFARGDDYRPYYAWSKGAASSGWDGEVVPPGTFSSGFAACALHEYLHVFASGDDRSVYHAWWNGDSWEGWVKGDDGDVGAGALTSAPAVAALGDTLHLFARGDDNDIWYAWWDGESWSGWSGGVLGKGRFSSGPAVASLGPYLHVFARGDDRRIYHNWWNGTTWVGWQKGSTTDVGVGTFSSTPATAALGDHLHVFARGDDRELYHSEWDGNRWSGWRRDGVGGNPLFSAPGAVSDGKYVHVLAQGDDRQIINNRLNGGSWSGWRSDFGGGSFHP